jgi:hypothetical protein
MKRAVTILAVAAAGAFSASVPAHAGDVSTADRIVNAVYADLGMTARADEPQKKGGFFVGLHSGLGADTGIAPAAAGLSVPLLDQGAESITANGYYVFSPGWSLDTYVGGGFGKMNLGDQPLLLSQGPAGTYAYQGMAGLSFALSPSMTLGLEYRYSEQFNNPLFTQSTSLPRDDERDQSVTLRFDFLLN